MEGAGGLVRQALPWRGMWQNSFACAQLHAQCGMFFRPPLPSLRPPCRQPSIKRRRRRRGRRGTAVPVAEAGEAPPEAPAASSTEPARCAAAGLATASQNQSLPSNHPLLSCTSSALYHFPTSSRRRVRLLPPRRPAPLAGAVLSLQRLPAFCPPPLCPSQPKRLLIYDLLLIHTGLLGPLQRTNSASLFCLYNISCLRAPGLLAFFVFPCPT